MATHLPRAETIGALATSFSELRALLAGLDDDAWATPTALPGWDVRANAAHIIGTEAFLAGDPTPTVEVDAAALPHVRNDIGAMNEAWVLALAEEPPQAILDRLDDVTGRRLESLRAMTDEEWDAEGFTPAGRDAYGRFMRIRVFDCWMHEHDIRDAVGLPPRVEAVGAGLALDEMETALGFVVGKRAGAPDGTAVTFALTGPAGRDIHVVVDGRAAVVPSLDRPADVTLTTDVHTFTRLAGGRTRWAETDDDRVAIDGDRVLGVRLLENLAFTI